MRSVFFQACIALGALSATSGVHAAPEKVLIATVSVAVDAQEPLLVFRLENRRRHRIGSSASSFLDRA